MTIEKLEALDRAATAGPWAYEPIYWAFRMAEKAGNTHVPDDLSKDAVYPKRDDAVFMAESRNALPALLAVAKAAKKFDVAMACCDPHAIGIAQRGIREALAQLEAKP